MNNMQEWQDPKAYDVHLEKPVTVQPAEKSASLVSPLFKAPSWLQLIVVAVVFCLLAYGCIVYTRESSRIATIWIANSALLAVLLEAPKARKYLFLAAAYIGNVAANLISGDSIPVAAFLAMNNSIEVLIAVLILLRGRDRVDLSKPSDLLSFFWAAGIFAPLAAAILAAMFLHFWAGTGFITVAQTWYLADALGLLTGTPFLIARLSSFDKKHELEAIRQPAGLLLLLACFGSTAIIFWYSQQSLHYLVLPLLYLTAYRIGLLGAAIGNTFLALVSIIFTFQGHGPFGALSADLETKVILLQLFIVTSALVSLVTAAIITQQRRMRAELSELTRMALTSSKAKSEFVANMSHELRTPLTSIRGVLGLLPQVLSGTLTDQGKSLVKIGVANADRLLRMINDILDTEQIESGKISVSLKALELGPILDNAVDMAHGYLPEKKITIVKAFEHPHLKATIDPSRLEQVLFNLLSNAIKFSPNEGTVTIGLKEIEGGSKVRIYVEDNGPGIPDSFRSRIFQKFEQADSGDARSKNGSGLGLSISKALVEAMHGTIGYQASAPTVFYIDLPLEEDQQDQYVANTDLKKYRTI
ncbi:MASE1 domain-containing protein [Roseibium litorale]|uniref:histidine kinase n=1 Tax=Roseibium litorale TaxID=2803841 RepID=A0ABR9CSH7_9HYPH|nr:MASE1 domain-containing protein [Roseibium litorale]MBD8893653.1 MASE1 domain-containing protein [Roseibium litorale]